MLNTSFVSIISPIGRFLFSGVVAGSSPLAVALFTYIRSYYCTVGGGGVVGGA